MSANFQPMALIYTSVYSRNQNPMAQPDFFEKNSFWTVRGTLAACEWRAAAAGLKPLRLPRAPNYRVVKTSSTAYQRNSLGVLPPSTAHDGVSPSGARHKCAQCDALLKNKTMMLSSICAVYCI